MRPLKKDEEKLVILKGIMTEAQADKLWDWVGKLGVRSCSMKEREPKVLDAIAIDVGVDGVIK